MRAFVLGGGGHLGAYQVGMLRALLERDITPDLILGTSVGALNGAAVSAEPTLEMVDRLEQVWLKLDTEPVFTGSVFAGARQLVRSRTHLYPTEPLRDLMARLLPVKRIEDLAVRFACVAACIERAAEEWFTEGPIDDAVLASAAVPGLLAPVEIGGEHFVDGGLVNSVPIARAVAEGARDIYVLHVGRTERPLTSPRNPWEVAMVAFEIARRHRFAADMGALPEGVAAHVLPTGEDNPGRFSDLSTFRYRDFSKVARRIANAHAASATYLDLD